MAQFQQRVYLLRRGTLHKIGLSWRAPYRATTLDAVVIHEIVTDDAVWLERELHRRYAAVRVRGEWFDLSPSQVDELCSVASLDRPPHGGTREPAPLGERLQALRHAAGLTQGRLAEMAGLKPSLVAAIERGGADPRLSAARRIAAALGLTLDGLAGGPS